MKKVYVLGAGFPVQGDLPTLQDFFAKVEKKKDKTDKYEGEEIEKETFETVLRLKQDKCGGSYNMESAFNAISSKEDFNNGKKFDGDLPEREQLIKDFLYTVCRTFHLCWTDGGRRSKWLYHRFLEAVIGEQATLLTFNYDLILDNLFFDMGLLPYYGFKLEEKNMIHFNKNFHQLKESGVTFLKMHGSQKWFKCNSCHKEFAKIDFNDTWPSGRGTSRAFSSDEKCISCHRKTMDYLIIPPLIDKGNPDEKLLKAVWKIAECKIREAEEIVFVGYSFPESDENIQERFRCWLKENTTLSSVTVVNPNAGKPDFKKPFEEIFGCSNRPPDTAYIPKTFLYWFLKSIINP